MLIDCRHCCEMIANERQIDKIDNDAGTDRRQSIREDKDILDNCLWFNEHYKEIESKNDEQWIVINQGAGIDSDTNLDILFKRLRTPA